MALALFTACSDATGPTSPIAAYALTSVDAKPLPATMYADTGYSLVVTAGAITLTADNKFTTSVTTRETVEGNISTYVDVGTGTWEQLSSGAAITLKPTGGTPLPAALSGTRLTVTWSDGVFIYSRAP